MPAREALLLINSCVTASSSSSDSSKRLRNSTTTYSCAGLKVVFKLCGLCDASSIKSRLRHFLIVASLTFNKRDNTAVGRSDSRINARVSGVVVALACCCVGIVLVQHHYFYYGIARMLKILQHTYF